MANVFTRVIGQVLRLSPRAFRERFAPEIVSTMSDALADERRRHGRFAMAALGVRGVVDAARITSRERRLRNLGRGPWSDWSGDVRYVLRGWRRTPSYVLTILATLTLGIGLASAIFSFADGYLFKGLPFPKADRLYTVYDPNSTIATLLHASDTVALRQSEVRDLGFVEWDAAGLGAGIVIGDRLVDARAFQVTRDFRRTVVLPLLRGRDFTTEDHDAGTPVIAAWLSYKFWMREFGGDEGVIGRVYALKAARPPSQIQIVGVLGPEVASFDLNNPPPDVVTPQREPARVGPNNLSQPIICLTDGVSVDQATTRIAAALQSAAPSADGRPRVVRLIPVRESQIAGGRPTARVFLAGALLVLLLVAINHVHLLLTRTVGRAVELATRAALGATRWRMARLLMTESLLIGVVGAAGGISLGWWLSGIISDRVPTFHTAGRNLSMVPMAFDARVVAFGVLTGLAVALIGGSWPAWRVLRQPAMNVGRGSGGISMAVPRRASRWVLTSALAVSTVVILGVSFIGLGIWRYLNKPLGFDMENRATIYISSTQRRQIESAEIAAALRELRQEPGVRAAGPAGPTSTTAPQVPGRALNPKSVGAGTISAGYSETWNLRVLAGRWFEPSEFADDAPFAVVDASFAREAWPGGNPIGQLLRVGPGAMRQVIGVIAPIRDRLDRDQQAYVYVPAARPAPRYPVTVWVGSSIDRDVERRLTTAVQRAIPSAETKILRLSLDTLFFHDVGEARFQTPIMIAFGVLAFVLAGIGVFGLVSYLVAQRTREWGIRMALGARPDNIWRAVLRESVVPALAGLAIGVPTAAALESVVRSQVFGWQSSGWVASLATATAIIVVALVASIAPGRRAIQIDPARVLRAD